MQSRITLDTLLKVALCQKHFAITPSPPSPIDTPHPTHMVKSRYDTSLVKEQGKKVMLKPCKQKRVMSHQDLKPHRKPRIRDHIWGREKEEYKAD